MSINEGSLLKQYTAIVDATTIVSKTDLNGLITYVNDQFIKISGYTEDELIGKPHSIIRHVDMQSLVFKDLWSTIQSKKVWNGVITNLKKNSKKYTVNASIFPILNDDGDIVEYIAIRHDITELQEANEEIQKLYDYNLTQEKIARKKLEEGIVNDLVKENCQVLYYPSDILSGDFYSIYKRSDGSIFIYLMDGQGHGVSPAFTVFSISSMLKQIIYSIDSLEELVEQLAPSIKNFLSEEEQLSYTMMMISGDKKSISYSSAGMYPFLIKTENEILKVKANNTPFMNFSPTPQVDKISLINLQSLFIYSDGLVEHEENESLFLSPEYLIQNPTFIKKAIEEISVKSFDDDVTFIYLNEKTL